MSVQAYDPPIINAFHQSDPAAHVWKHDPHTVYVYGSHDWNSTTASDDVGSQVCILMDLRVESVR
jgi:hypothetical protein